MNVRPKDEQRRPWGRIVTAGSLVLALGVAIGWAGATVFTPPQDVLDSTRFTFVEAVQGEVGASIRLNAVAEWTPTALGSNQAQGIVTSVIADAGQEVGPGAVLYTVDLRPVAIAKGDVPAFRSLDIGTSGADVAQLQAMLAELGFYAGSADGKFGYQTARAVRSWQKSIGTPSDGVIQRGDIVFVPNLPVRVSLDPEVIARGLSLSGGETAVRGLLPEPDFTMPVTDKQAAVIPVGTRIVMSSPAGSEWQATVAGQLVGDDQATVTLVLGGLEEGSICGAECGAIPVGEQSLLRSEVITTEMVHGVVVPLAALSTKPDGTTVVIDGHDIEHEVAVLARARGMVAVDGIGTGTRVRVPAEGD